MVTISVSSLALGLSLLVFILQVFYVNYFSHAQAETKSVFHKNQLLFK